MKPRTVWRGTFVLLLSSTLCRAQFAIDWHTIDGGGGLSTGGVYSCSGTIGQPDAGAMSGGAYSLSGGFWNVITVIQTPGAPVLSIRLAGANTIIISWPSPSTGFVLEQNGSLATVNWTPVTESSVDNGTTKSVSVVPSFPRRFYRLRK